MGWLIRQRVLGRPGGSLDTNSTEVGSMLRSLLGVVFLLSPVSVAVPGEPLLAPPPRLIPVAEWVEQLGSKDTGGRDASAKRLSALALNPPPELLALAKSKDTDIGERASKVAQNMRWNVAATRLSRGQRFVEQGRIDLFVAATAIWDLKPDDSRLWVPAVDLGRKLIEEADMQG